MEIHPLAEIWFLQTGGLGTGYGDMFATNYTQMNGHWYAAFTAFYESDFNGEQTWLVDQTNANGSGALRRALLD